MPKALLLLAASVALTAACSDEDDQAEGSGLVDSFITALEATIDVECACRQVSSQDCANAKQSLRQCVDGALATDTRAAQMFPRCAVQAIREYNACLRTLGTCGADGIEGVEMCSSEIDARDCELPEVLAPCFPDAAPATPALGGTPTMPAEPVTPSMPAGLCSDSCAFDGRSVAGDGECDDGGPDSDYEVCDLGTDCTDCGPR